MEDKRIVELYWARAEAAIVETQKKYGKFCRCIAYNILRSHEDAEECVNDTYVNAWNSIPPQRPERLKPFIGKITRNLALNRYDYNTAQKRSADTELAIDEFYECLPGTERSVDDALVLKEAVNSFLAALPKRTRIIFMRRYWYLCTVKEIAESMHLTESNVKIILHRTRNEFRAYLEKEGISV